MPEGPPITIPASETQASGNGFFRTLSRKATAQLARISHPMSYPAGASIFAEGETAVGVYVLRRGRAKLFMTGLNGKRLILKIAGPGEILGLDSIVLEGPHELTAETLLPSDATLIAKHDFVRLLEEDRGAWRYATTQLALDCRSTYSTIGSIGSSSSVSEKLARFLIQRAASAQSSGGVLRLQTSLTHEEIAQIIGTSRETVTRILGSFKKRHIAELHGSALLIYSKAALHRIAGFSFLL